MDNYKKPVFLYSMDTTKTGFKVSFLNVTTEILT
jgi:hypothetical protein